MIHLQKMTIKRLLFAFSFLALIQSCNEKKAQQPAQQTPQKQPLTAQKIVDNAITVAGGPIIENATIHFKFRDHYYNAKRINGVATLERCTDAECQIQQDKIKENGEFVRFRESVPVAVPDSMAPRYSNSINSVHYFSVLPYGLNDPAVRKELLSPTTINSKPYHQIKVTFTKEGGGEDFDDQYVYWIHTETYKVDFLAYNYQVDEGGTRFREAYNERIVNGVRFVDYRNYKPEEQFPPLTDLGGLFESKKLNLLSKIELENISVMK